MVLGRCPQHRVEDGAVRRLVTDRAQRQPERVCDDAGQRRTRKAGDLRDLGDRDRGEATRVDRALEQSDRLLTDRSGGDEERQVHPVRGESGSDGGPRLLEQHVRLRDVAHEAVGPGGDRADLPFFRVPAQE